MSGERCAHRLLARIMTLKIRQAGGECEEGDVLKILSDIDAGRGGWGRGGWIGGAAKGGVTFTLGEAGREGVKPVVALVGTEWSIYLHLKPDGAGGTVASLLKDPLGRRQSWVHDLAGSSAGKTTVSTDEDYTAGAQWVPMAFVSREQHYSHGLFWDPAPDIAADTHFYLDGSVKWKRRYQGGRMMGRGDDSPAHESYWPDGALQAVEYGSVNFGRHRDPLIGPAYVECHPNGQKALEVFARRGKDGIVEVVGGGAWDSDGRVRTPGTHEGRTLSETDLVMARVGDDIDEYFEARRKDRAVQEAAAAAPESAKAVQKMVLSHPSGVSRQLVRGRDGVAKGRGGR